MKEKERIERNRDALAREQKRIFDTMTMNKVIMSVFTLIDIKDKRKSMNIINLNIYLKNKLFLISIISLICLSLIAFQETNKVHN
tara:strand:+ start:1396 stop:1650 length:255 start_codon:yes stop_codon:yes gene_type:complete